MNQNPEIYKEKAIEACREVFNIDYARSIGIPLPEIDFILPDSTNYKSGEYYIQIGETWQIHLNFGLLPISYKEFQEEVKVLVRHEIEHYMCCPFDVLTHFRILKSIILTYKDLFSYLKINILQLSGSIANQAADIIIDTKNFRKYTDATLKSEIAWIKKGGHKVFSELPRHSKLMFLTKQALWKMDLGLDEEDVVLNKEVNGLAEQFENGGITNKSLFIEKTNLYTILFFKLFEEDKNDLKKTLQNGQNGQPSDKQQEGEPQIIPSKDSQENGSQFIFQDPDKISQAIEQFAQECSLQEFIDVLSAASIPSLSEKDKQRIWFEAQNADLIPISELVPKGINDNYSYPVIWKVGDNIEDLDMMLSFAASPEIIPGITTKKWEKNPVFNYGSESEDADLLLVIDCSGSMGSIIDIKTNMHQAVLASYGIIKYFETKSSHIALINFSDRIVDFQDWTIDYDVIRDKLLINGAGGTQFPIDAIEEFVKATKKKIVMVVITDGEIQNTSYVLSFFREYLSAENKLFLFLQNKKATIDPYLELENYGAFVRKVITADEIRETVIDDLIVT